MTKDEIEARLAYLQERIDETEVWGAAVGAMHEEMKSLKSQLLQLDGTTVNLGADKLDLPTEVIAAFNALSDLIQKHNLMCMMLVARDGQEECKCDAENCGAIKDIKMQLYTGTDEHTKSMIMALTQFQMEFEALRSTPTPRQTFH